MPIPRSARALVMFAATTVPFLGVGPAAAATRPFTITEQVDFTGANANTFTATGLCPSGTFVDNVSTIGGNRNSGRGEVLIRSVYTCADGSGTFLVLKHVFVTLTANGWSSTGPYQILGGTGDWARTSGHGTDNGVRVGDSGNGLATGFLVG